MYMSDQILFFISLIRDSVPNAVEVYTQGNCGVFALILLDRFGGEIYYNNSHCVLHYNGSFYDITGDVTNEYREANMIPLTEFGISELVRTLKPKYNGK